MDIFDTNFLYAKQAESEWRSNLKKMSILDLDKDIAVRMCINKKKEYNQYLQKEISRRRDLMARGDWFAEYQVETANERIKELRKKIESFDYKFKMLKGKIQKRDIPIEQIKEIPIDSIIQIDWQKIAHNRWKCRCPLHNEKTPSFVYYVDQNSFNCFGCGKSGSVIDFYMFIHNQSLSTAIKELSKLVL